MTRGMCRSLNWTCEPSAATAQPVIQAADKALDTGSADHLVKQVADSVAAGIRERFNRVKEAKKHAEESVPKGREFVEAYVEFTHYVERLAADAEDAMHRGAAEPATGKEHQH